MRRLTTLALAVLVSASAHAANRVLDGPGGIDPRPAVAYRHFVLTPQRLLNDDEQADLRRRGVIIQSAVAGGRYLVAIAPGSSVDDSDPRVARLEPLTVNSRVHRTALREVATGKPYVHLNIQFHDDVSFAQAKAAIESAGGALEDVLQRDYSASQRIRIVIPSSSVQTLGSDERVLFVFGPSKLEMVPENATSAAMSNVTPLFSGPYNLSGQGVTLSYFELAQADASHPEFGGRLTTHLAKAGSSGDQQHATHVGGTMIAAGLDPTAKGMAPNARLEEFGSDDNNFLDLKQGLLTYGSVADNNSWGYVIGWCRGTTKCTGWVWGDTDIYYGAYDAMVTAPLDKIAKQSPVLFVHSAGNDAQNTGPSDQWFTHQHEDNNGDIITGKTYCYSADGSGTDCPQPTCSAGPLYCEVKRHPRITDELPDPWLSMGVTASAKDILAVGAVSGTLGFTPGIASFSSRGPTRDGRVKPDLVARGVNVHSTYPPSGSCPAPCYGTLNGTSMAAPVVTGSAALLTEQWRRMFGGQNPPVAALKTLMIATADDLGNPGPDFTYGFGLLNAKAAVDTIIADGGQGRRIKTDGSVTTGGVVQVPLTVPAAQTLRVVVGWADPEVLIFDPDTDLAAQTLVNDLDLKVIAPDNSEVLPYVLKKLDPTAAATRGVNNVDNTEEVEIANAAAGPYKIVVTGRSVTAQSPQSFVIVTNADMAGAAVPCSDPYAQYNSVTSAYGNLVSGQFINGRTCDAATSNYFKFLVDKPGTVSVTVTATDTPVRATLSSGATADVTVDVAAGTTQTISTQYNGAGTTFYVRVQPTGAIGSLAKYTITPAFPYAQHLKRRSVRTR